MRLPKNRPPSHPGKILREEFLKPAKLSQRRLAEALGIPFREVHEIVHGRRRVDESTARLLAAYFKTTEALWNNLQANCDRYEALKRPINRRD